MRDYAELINRLRRSCAILVDGGKCEDCAGSRCMEIDAADAIEELLAFAKFVAREAIDTGDNDGVSAEILCRKLNKLGLIEKDGAWWTLPAPPKEVHDA